MMGNFIQQTVMEYFLESLCRDAKYREGCLVYTSGLITYWLWDFSVPHFPQLQNGGNH